MSGNKLLGWGLPLLVAAIPAAAFYTLGLRSFYINGAWWGDAGILASVMWHSGWALRLPLVAGDRSFLATHMALVFWLTSGFSWLLPFSRVQFFALFLGAVQGLMAVPVYVLLLRLGTGRIAAALLAILFAFNGLVLAASCNPHFELLIVASGMAFLAALACEQVWLARLFFILCLATREDAGFHLAFLLLAGGAGLYWQGVERQKLRPFLRYAAAAACWSVMVIAIQHIAFPGGNAMREVYLGSPVFSEVSPKLLATRLGFYVAYRLYLVLPFAVALMLARYWSLPSLFAGFAAGLPWLGLNWLAVSPIAGTLSNYYSFPLVFGLFWPLAGQVLARQFGARRILTYRQTLWAFILVLVSSFVGLGGLQNPQHIRFPADFFYPPSLANQMAAEQSMVNFRNTALGRVAVDGSVMALDPDHFKRSQWVWSKQSTLPDTVIFFPRGQGTKAALQLASRAGLANYYEAPGTNLRLATNRQLNVKALKLCPWAESAGLLNN